MRFSPIKFRLETLQRMNVNVIAIVISALMRPTFPSRCCGSLTRVRNMPFRTRNSERERNLFVVARRRMRALPPSSSSSSRPSVLPSVAVISGGHSIISRRHRRTHQLNSLTFSLGREPIFFKANDRECERGTRRRRTGRRRSGCERVASEGAAIGAR